MREQLGAKGVRILELRGTYQNRETPNAALAPLHGEAPALDDPGPEEDGADVPIAALGALGDPAGRSSRRRGGERRAGTIMGVAYSVRTRGGASMDPSDYWSELRASYREPGTAPLAILVDDGSLVDPESRNFLLYLSERLRYRPVVMVVALDVGEPGFAGWEERLIGRNDVDWVRFASPRPDPREAHRMKQMFDGLPVESQRVLALASLLGGSTTEVKLSRVTRLNFSQLGDALLPASELHLVRTEAGKVTIPHAEWAHIIPEFLSNQRVRELHREIAEALEAMSPESTLASRTELAEHLYRWEAGPAALRYLLEAAELTERLSAYDGVLALVDDALHCVGGLPGDDRPAVEVELRLFRTRALFFAGRPAAAGAELRTAIALALEHHIAPATLEEWVELLVPSLVAVGPRPELLNELSELADRAHEGGLVAVEVLFRAILAGHEQRRGRAERARGDSRRAGLLARNLEPGAVQATALLAIAVALLDGAPAEQELAERFRAMAHGMLGTVRRSGLQQLAEEMKAVALTRSGDAEGARAIHVRAVSALQRLRLHAFELPHQLGIAELTLDERGGTDAAARALRRARELVELLHLTPPSPSVLRLWLLEGRFQALAPAPEEARERYRAITDRPTATSLPQIRRSALLRLSDLELSEGRDEEARRAFDALDPDAFAPEKALTWEEWRDGRKSRAVVRPAPPPRRARKPRPRATAPDPALAGS
jgi:hypothetical protein